MPFNKKTGKYEKCKPFEVIYRDKSPITARKIDKAEMVRVTNIKGQLIAQPGQYLIDYGSGITELLPEDVFNEKFKAVAKEKSAKAKK